MLHCRFVQRMACGPRFSAKAMADPQFQHPWTVYIYVNSNISHFHFSVVVDTDGEKCVTASFVFGKKLFLGNMRYVFYNMIGIMN